MKKRDITIFAAIAGVFGFCYFLPLNALPLSGPLAEMLALVKDYARQHVLLCLIPAFFIAGAIATFISSGAVMKYLGAEARKVVAYAVAAISGTVLAVCSCT
ncbi:MAG: permease, partial [Phycisphaerae bacterium]|nr:permease [Phycisphaerae bacterium]